MSTERDDDCRDLSKLEKRIEDELDKVRKEVDDLYETVYKGNGHPSLVTRVNSVEGKLRGLREQMDEKISHLSREHSLKFESIHQKLESKFGRLEGWIDTKFSSMESMMRTVAEQNKIDRTGSWQMKTAIIGGVVAIVGSIIAYFSSKSL
jgi:hypothetical protein